MAGNYAQLLDIINNPTNHSLPAWDNNNHLIEGLTVKQYLLTIIQSLTAGYQFMGVATPSTSPGTPDPNVFYIGGKMGEYANFNNISIGPNEIAILKWNGSWSKESFYIPITGGTIEVVTADDGYYRTDGSVTSGSFVRNADYIKVEQGDRMVYTGWSGNNTVGAILGYNANKTLVEPLLVGGDAKYNAIVDIPNGVEYVRCCVASSEHANYIVPHIVIVKNQSFLNLVDELATTISTITPDLTALKNVVGTYGSLNQENDIKSSPDDGFAVFQGATVTFNNGVFDVNCESSIDANPGLRNNQPVSWLKSSGKPILITFWIKLYDSCPVNYINFYYAGPGYGISINANNQWQFVSLVLTETMVADMNRLQITLQGSGQSTPNLGYYIRDFHAYIDGSVGYKSEYSFEKVNELLPATKQIQSDINVDILDDILISDHSGGYKTTWWNATNSLTNRPGTYIITGATTGLNSVKLATALNISAVTRDVATTRIDVGKYSFEILDSDIEANVAYVRIALPTGADIQLQYVVQEQIIGEVVKELQSRPTDVIDLRGKNIAVIGDSISTISGNNNPYWKVLSIDVGQEIQAYVTWWDVWTDDAGTTPTGKTIGGVTLTSEMIGTLQTFTPVAGDVGKSIGVPANYNPSTTKVWSEKLCELTGATLLANASWSGSRICSGQTGTWVLSEAWNDFTIGCCKKRDDEGNDIIPDIIFIYRGTNDFSHGPISRINDVSLANGIPATDYINSVYEYRAGYYKTIQKLREAYPKAYIVCCTLNVFKRVTYDVFPTRNSYYTLPQMNDVIRDIANIMGCGLIEFDKDGITFENCYSQGYITDSATTPTHPNSKGHEVMAERAISDLKYILQH